MRDLLRYLKDYKKECVLAPFFKALEAAFELLVPLVIARMIDVGIRESDRVLLFKCTLFLLILALVGFLSSVTAQYFAAKAAVGFSTAVRRDLFSRMLHFPFSKIDEIGASTMITRLTGDVNQVQAGVNMALRLFLRSPYIVIGATIMSFLIDRKLALIFVGLILVLFTVVALLSWSNLPLLAIVQEKMDTLTLAVRENLSGTRVIRAFNRQEEQIEGFTEKNGQFCLAQRRSGWRSALLNPVTYVVINLFIVWLIRAGALRVHDGALSGGNLIALYNYMSQILIELIKFASLLITVNRALASAKRISGILRVPDAGGGTIKDGGDQRSSMVEFEHVSFSYHAGADEVLSDIDLSIKKGEWLGIIGGTGSGKTTLAHLLCGFYEPGKGSIYLNGLPLSTYETQDLREKIGIVMQKSVLFSGTIADNLRWGNEHASDEQLLEAARAACCEDVIEAHGGLSGEVLQGGSNYSGGQRQRLCIARALVQKPELLILDDSFSALDYVTDRKLKENLRKITPKPTVIIISQRTVSISDCDHILVLEDGVVAGFGTHKTLLKKCDIYAEIQASQGGE